VKGNFPVKLCTVVFAVMFVVQSSFAIGMWIKGNVTTVPWVQNNHRYVILGNVKFTIMDEAVAMEVVEKKDAVYKTEIDISDLRRGDDVLVQAEGNRIYQIEILR
jgi:hypothetical protein